MYDTVLKRIIHKIENNYNIFIPKDIIQLIYSELNKKHQCAIMISNRIKRPPLSIPEKYRIIDYMRHDILKFILIEYTSIYDYQVIFYDKDVYERILNMHNMKRCYRSFNRANYIQQHIDRLLEFGLNPNGFFKKC